MSVKSIVHTFFRIVFQFRHPAMIAVAAIVLGSGCVTNGRHILLKEYGASIAPQSNIDLKGVTICVKEFTCAPSLVAMDIKGKGDEPQPYKYIERPHEQDLVWDKEMHALQKQVAKTDQMEIGNMRDGFGIVMSHVYALNNPGEWLTQSLKYDLEAQGAKVVDASQAADADVVVSGTIQHCKTDMYTTVEAQLVIDLGVQPKSGEVWLKTIHTHGATAAVLASEGEYFHAYRDARQKFSILACRQISEAFKVKKESDRLGFSEHH
jgi:hypothetical protein